MSPPVVQFSLHPRFHGALPSFTTFSYIGHYTQRAPIVLDAGNLEQLPPAVLRVLSVSGPRRQVRRRPRGGIAREDRDDPEWEEMLRGEWEGGREMVLCRSS